MNIPPGRTLSQIKFGHKQDDWFRDNPEYNPITIKAKAVSLAAEKFSCITIFHCSLPRLPFPIKSFALSEERGRKEGREKERLRYFGREMTGKLDFRISL